MAQASQSCWRYAPDLAASSKGVIIVDGGKGAASKRGAFAGGVVFTKWEYVKKST